MDQDWIEQYGKGLSGDRSFDIAYWQAQSSEARWNAAWDLVVHYWLRQGKPLSELKMDRSIEEYVRVSRTESTSADPS